MLYTDEDQLTLRRQLTNRILIDAAIFLIPFAIGVVIMYTSRREWLSVLLSMLGLFGAIFYTGMCLSPFLSYWRFLRDIRNGRSRSFRGELLREESGSLREGIRCRTLYFSDDEKPGEERLCYLDREKEYAFVTGCKYEITTHGQSIIAIVEA